MGKKLPVSLFIGRFQPFHKGHLAALKYISARSSRVLLVIGSAQLRNEPKNPFSASERKTMITAELREAGLSKKCRVLELTDINNDARWVSHVDAHVPRYDVCFSNNALVLKLMRKAGKKVARVPFFRKESYNATKIRARIKKGEKWADRVPRVVLERMEKIKAEERIKRLG